MRLGGELMETSKVKNIMIVILLGLNLFLAALVVLDQSESERAAASSQESVRQVLGQYGVGLSEDIDMSAPAPQAYTVRRDMEKELALMQELLGSVRAEDLGGNIRYYYSAAGQASARGTGELDVLFTSGSTPRGRDTAATAAKVLKKLGGEGCAELASVSVSGTSTVVEMPYMFSGGVVFNSRMTLTFGQSGLLMISGVRLFDTAVPSGTQTMNALTAIVRFAEVIGESGYVCSELLGLDSGYIMTVTVSGESTLTPVWRFTTDTGSIYINAATGSVESV